MRWLDRLTVRLRSLFRRGRIEADLDRELRFHLDQQITENLAAGMSLADARVAALRTSGSIIRAKEDCRESLGLRLVDDLRQDARYAARALTKNPGFTIVAVLTLALAIGANTTVFSALDAVLLRPLPFPDADRLMQLRQVQDRTAETNIAPVRLEDWHRLNVTFEAISGYFTEDVSETSTDLPERVRRAFVTPRFLDVWGVRPAVGRGFTEAEHSTSGPAAVLISDAYWRVRLAADPNVLGKTVRIGTASLPIVGVMSRSFLFPDRSVDLWFPSPVDSPFAQARSATWYIGIGRLKQGVTIDQARANLDAVQAQLAEIFPQTDGNLRPDLTPLKETTIRGIRRSLWLLFAAVTMLTLIACTNFAGLLLTRGTHRRDDIALRFALGASRVRIATGILIETLLVSVVGASLGFLLAIAATAALRMAAADLPRIDEIALDWRIVLYTLATAFFVALCSGAVPAVRIARHHAVGRVGDGQRTMSTRNSVQWVLVGVQVSLSVTLLAGAGLLLRSFAELSRVDAGFDPSRVLTFRISGNFGETANYERLIGRIEGTVESLQALPGIESAATAGFLPGVPRQFEQAFALAEAQNDTERRMVAEIQTVSPEYFTTMKIAITEGTLCRRQAREPRPVAREVMVNRAFVARYLTGRSSPIGVHLSGDSTFGRPAAIAGVVADAREAGIDREPVPTVYLCHSAPNPNPVFLVRTRGEPQDLAQTVRLKVKESEPLRSVYDVAPLERRIDSAFAQNRLRTIVLAVFALTSLALAVVGLYGTLSFVVTLRRREVGVRLALGAERSAIIRQFVAKAVRVVIVGCGIGIALSLAASRLWVGMLYGVSSTDPSILSLVVVTVVLVSTLGALIPAIRAARVDPMVALRCD